MSSPIRLLDPFPAVACVMVRPPEPIAGSTQSGAGAPHGLELNGNPGYAFLASLLPSSGRKTKERERVRGPELQVSLTHMEVSADLADKRLGAWTTHCSGSGLIPEPGSAELLKPSSFSQSGH